MTETPGKHRGKHRDREAGEHRGENTVTPPDLDNPDFGAIINGLVIDNPPGRIFELF